MAESADARHHALVIFLGAGLSPAPTRALLVSALADARRCVAALRASRSPLDRWIADEVRLGGLRENAAVLAALEDPRLRDRVAAAYSQRHPGRTQILRDVLRRFEACS